MNQVINRSKIEDICKENDIAFLGVFGSYARGEGTRKSDIDLLARFLKRKSLFDLVGIENELSKRLGKKVDLVTEGGLSPYLKDRILHETKTIYEFKG